MYKKFIKRIFDIVLSLIAIIILSPIYLLISILILIFDGRPVFFTQERTGRDGKNFKIFKFRTMVNRKVTKLGKILRMTSLDELPQLANVLKGDMSLIGPRPWVPEYYENFTEEQKRRADVRPGMIGLAQVNGRNKIGIFKKLEYDTQYARECNLLLDIKIILKCFRVLFVKENLNNIAGYETGEIEVLRNQNKKQEKEINEEI